MRKRTRDLPLSPGQEARIPAWLPCRPGGRQQQHRQPELPLAKRSGVVDRLRFRAGCWQFTSASRGWPRLSEGGQVPFCLTCRLDRPKCHVADWQRRCRCGKRTAPLLQPLTVPQVRSSEPARHRAVSASRIRTLRHPSDTTRVSSSPLKEHRSARQPGEIRSQWPSRD